MLESILEIMESSWFLEGTIRLVTVLTIQLIILFILKYTPVRDAVNEGYVALSIVYVLVTLAISWVISINFIEITVNMQKGDAI